MYCPFCNGRMRQQKTEIKNLPMSAPYITMNYQCKTPECGAVIQLDSTYKKTLSPSGYGHIDRAGRVIKYLPHLPQSTRHRPHL